MFAIAEPENDRALDFLKRLVSGELSMGRSVPGPDLPDLESVHEITALALSVDEEKATARVANWLRDDQDLRPVALTWLQGLLDFGSVPESAPDLRDAILARISTDDRAEESLLIQLLGYLGTTDDVDILVRAMTSDRASIRSVGRDALARLNPPHLETLCLDWLQETADGQHMDERQAWLATAAMEIGLTAGIQSVIQETPLVRERLGNHGMSTYLDDTHLIAAMARSGSAADCVKLAGKIRSSAAATSRDAITWALPTRDQVFVAAVIEWLEDEGMGRRNRDLLTFDLVQGLADEEFTRSLSAEQLVRLLAPVELLSWTDRADAPTDERCEIPQQGAPANFRQTSESLRRDAVKELEVSLAQAVLLELARRGSESETRALAAKDLAFMEGDVSVIRSRVAWLHTLTPDRLDSAARLEPVGTTRMLQLVFEECITDEIVQQAIDCERRIHRELSATWAPEAALGAWEHILSNLLRSIERLQASELALLAERTLSLAVRNVSTLAVSVLARLRGLESAPVMRSLIGEAIAAQKEWDQRLASFARLSRERRFDGAFSSTEEAVRFVRLKELGKAGVDALGSFGPVFESEITPPDVRRLAPDTVKAYVTMWHMA